MIYMTSSALGQGIANGIRIVHSILFMVFFAVQKLLSLIRSHLFIFVFIFITLGSGSKKILMRFLSKRKGLGRDILGVWD